MKRLQPFKNTGHRPRAALVSAVMAGLAGLLGAQTPVVQFAPTDRFGIEPLGFVAEETATNAVIHVRRDGNTNTTVTVDYAVADGTARAGADYLPVSGTLTFLPGETNRAFFVPVIADGQLDSLDIRASYFRDPETVQLSLLNPGGGAILGPRSNSVLRVFDNESPSVLDATFNFRPDPNLSGYRGADDSVFALTVLADGRILIVGGFTLYNGVSRGRIAQLLPDGELDSSFDPGTGANGDAYAMAVQPDGKILLGGEFSQFNGQPAPYLVRLNTNGSRDTNFVPATIDNELRGIAIQPDGRILIGGRFTMIGSSARGRVARLNIDGSLDPTFNPSGGGANDRLRALVLQPDGRILIGGQFTSVNGTARRRIARLNADGTLDTTFDPGTGADGQVRAISCQSDGRVIIGGEFTNFNGVLTPNLARLHTNGVLDTNFALGAGPASVVRGLTVQPDDRILVGGAFGIFDNQARRRLARLNADGSLDGTLLCGGAVLGETGPRVEYTGPDDEVFALALQGADRLVIGGQFVRFGGQFTATNLPVQARVARLFADSRQTSFRFGEVENRATETNPVALLEVWRDGVTTGTVSVAWFTSDQTATPGVDYVPTNGVVTFGPLETRRQIAVRLLNDALPDPEVARFRVTLTNASAGAGLGFPISARVNIVDNDRGFFFPGDYLAASDDGSPGPTVRVARVSDQLPAATVEVQMRDLNTTGGVDYGFTNITLTFAAGQATQSFVFPIIADTLAEGVEQVDLVLANPSPNSGIGGPAVVPLVIFDVDSTFYFNSTNWVDEGSPSVARYSISRTGPARQAVTIHVGSLGGSATAGQDFIIRSNALTFAPGETTREFFVEVVNDGIVEGVETAVLAITNVTTFGQITPPARGMLFVYDNDRGVELDTSIFYAGEAGPAVLRARRGDDGRDTLTVRYTVEPLAAVPGQDLPLLTNGQFTLLPGLAPQSFTIPLLDDTVAEPVKTFRVRLTHGDPGVVIGYTDRAEVQIYDNDSHGALDASFTGLGASNLVLHLAVQADGSLLVGNVGRLFVGDELMPPLLRFLPSGALDRTFVMAPLPHNGLTDVKVQPDGKVLIGSRTNEYLAPGAKTLRRLTPNGACDPMFLDSCNSFSSEHFTGKTAAIGVSPDGAVVLGGQFGSSFARLGLERHLPDGRLDTNFICYFSNQVDAVAVQPDGMILASGAGTLFRVRTNGTFDPGFHVTVGAPLHTILVQPDGRILIGGSFHEVGGLVRSNLARLNPDGTVDTTFAESAGTDGEVYALALQADGHALIGGYFRRVAGVDRAFLARLSASGAVDPFFNSGPGPDGPVFAIAPLPDGRVYVGGWFFNYDYLPFPALIRLQTFLDAHFTAIDLVPGGVRLTIAAPPGRRLVVQATSDFSQWTSIATNVATNGMTQVFRSLTVPQRYFRVQEQTP